MSSNESYHRRKVVYRKNARVPCNCGWEVRFGYGVAVTLAIFEAKRFFMLILEIFAEWQIIRFAGGLRPVIFTLINISLGLPTALMTVRTIRARKVPRCCAETKRTLKCLLIAITICAITNASTLISIGCHMSIRQEALIDIFNSSMQFYASASSYKYAIDEIQFIFQCCGHTSYADWFQFDWQGVDYASRDQMAVQRQISDEQYRDRGVPFSCCNLRVMAPCEHTDIDDDVKTINTNGCAQVVSPVILRIVIVAYVMTSTLVIIQVFLAFLITKMIRRLLCGMCRFYHFPSIFANESSSESLVATSSETERRESSSSPSKRELAKKTKTIDKRRRKNMKRPRSRRYLCAKNKRNVKDDSNPSSSPIESSPVNERVACKYASDVEAARIRPSVHEQHTILKKPLYDEAH